MKNGRGIDKLHAVLIGNRARFVELLRIESDRLLAQHVLAGRKYGTQVRNMGIVRRGNIHRVDSGVGAKLLERIVHAGHAVLLGKSDRLFVRAVVDAGEFAASELERGSHLVGNHATTDNSPRKLGSREDIIGKRLALNRSEGGAGRLGGITRCRLLRHTSSSICWGIDLSVILYGHRSGSTNTIRVHATLRKRRFLP